MNKFGTEESKINSENLLNEIQICKRQIFNRQFVQDGEETALEIVDPNTTVAATVDMEVENVAESKEKRSREEEEEPKDDVFTKKAKVADEKSVEEERLEKLEKNEGDEKEEKEASGGGVNLGPITFTNFFMLGLRISMLTRYFYVSFCFIINLFNLCLLSFT